MSAKTKIPIAAKICFFIAILALLALLAIATNVVSQGTRVSSITPSPNLGGDAYDYEDGFPVVDWAYWQDVNPDVIAWVTIPGTNIDTPIVQAHPEDPEYYLYHNIYGEWSYLGCPYLDASMLPEGTKSLELLVYGHNTGFDGLQFFDLQHFTNYEFASTHRIVLFQTPDIKRRLTIMSVDIINAADTLKVTDYADMSAMQDWYRAQFAGSDVQIEEMQDIEQLFTFVTCSYIFTSNERTVVYAAAETETVLK